MRAFISYSHSDREFVERLARYLRSLDVEARYDQTLLRPGDNFVERLEQGLDDSDFLIVILSNAGVTSSGV